MDVEASPEARLAEPFPIAVLNIYLVHAHFVDKENPAADPSPFVADELPFNIQFAFVRPSFRSLVVAMICDVETDKPYSLNVMYAGEFAMDPEYPNELVESAWKDFAARVAPVIIYPYVREFVSDMTNRSRSTPLVLPVLYVSRVLDAATLELPQPKDDSPPVRSAGKRGRGRNR